MCVCVIYVLNSAQNHKSSFVAHFSILFLEVETGKDTTIYDNFTRLNRKRHSSNRLCASRNLRLCEDEIHFMLISVCRNLK